MTFLLALLFQADLCACGGCEKAVHLTAIGSCRSCAAEISNKTDRLCETCAKRTLSCAHCGKGVKPPELCACGGCQVQPHPDPACGKCVACAAVLASCDDRLCRACASVRKACAHCTKGLPPLEAVVGVAAVPDKQPRPDATYVVIQAEAGNRGVYASREGPQAFWYSGRGLASLSGDRIRSWHPLGPVAHDLELNGGSEKPVRWRMGEVEGPLVAPVDVRYRLKIPCFEGETIEVVSAGKVLARRRYAKGKWSTPD